MEEIGWGKRVAFALLLCLAISPIVALPLLPPLTVVDGALMVLYACFAAGVSMHVVSAVYSTTTETSSPSPWWEQWAAFGAWCAFRTIVTFDSLPCHVGYAVCRPEDDIHLQILMDILAFVLLVCVFILYYSIVLVMRREDATIWNELQLAYMAITFLTMLLQLLFQPPISPVIYALNFLLIVYTVYVVVQLTVRYGAANKAGLALFFVGVVMTMSFVNRWAAEKPAALTIIFGATSLLALGAAALLGVSGFWELDAELQTDKPSSTTVLLGKPTKQAVAAQDAARASLILSLVVAFLLLVALGLLHFLFPPATNFDFVIELIASIGLSILLRVMAFRRLPFSLVMVGQLVEIVAMVLVLALVRDASEEGRVWAGVELAVCMLVSVIAALVQFHLTPSRISPRAKMVIGGFLALGVAIATVIALVHSTSARLNLVIVSSAVLGLVVMAAIVRISSLSTKQQPPPERTNQGKQLGRLSPQTIQRMMLQKQVGVGV